MNPSFGASTIQATPGMNMSCVSVIGTVSASVENFVHERAPTQRLSSASLARRRPQSRWLGPCATVHASQFRAGRPRRGPTSEIRDRVLPGPALALRALVVPVRSHSVRPNYALQRTVIRQRNLWRHRAAAERER
jgi:hypothetical protein